MTDVTTLSQAGTPAPGDDNRDIALRGTPRPPRNRGLAEPRLDDDNACRQLVRNALNSANDLAYQRFPLPHEIPSFRSVAVAAANLLRVFPEPAALLCLRDACLHRLRVAVAAAGHTLVVGDRSTSRLYSIPADAVVDGVLRIEPMPERARSYTGDIDAVVIACHAYSTQHWRVYHYDICRTALALERIRDDFGGRYAHVPVIAVASDAQDIDALPLYDAPDVSCHAIVTPTRVVLPQCRQVIAVDALLSVNTGTEPATRQRSLHIAAPALPLVPDSERRSP